MILRLHRLVASMIAIAVSAMAIGQEVERFCEEGAKDCSDDRLVALFEDGTSSMEAPPAGSTFAVEFAIVAVTPRIQGWSFGVAHDDRYLKFEGATYSTTILDPAKPEGIDAGLIENFPQAVPGGFVTSFVLPFTGPGLPLGEQNVVILAEYSVRNNFHGSTHLRPTSGLGPMDAPRTDLALVSNGREYRPRFVRPAELRGVLPEAPFFHRGDTNDSGNADISDAILLLEYIFASEKAPRCLYTADVDASGDVNITDAVALLHALFLGVGPPLICEVDPTPRDAECHCST
ncbi:MAG: dockerin type I repeat-containing protein [Planctomycetota bacterium]